MRSSSAVSSMPKMLVNLPADCKGLRSDYHKTGKGRDLVPSQTALAHKHSRCSCSRLPTNRQADLLQGAVQIDAGPIRSWHMNDLAAVPEMQPRFSFRDI